jgi:transposase
MKGVAVARDLRLITDEQWKIIEPLLLGPKASPKGGPKPKPNRPCFEGILWVLRSGARWKDLPVRYPSPSTCRRLRDREARGVRLKAWRASLGALDEQQALHREECFTDASFSPAKKGATQSAKPNAERVRSGWLWQTAWVFLWECPWRRRRPSRSRSSSRRSER